jgi:hypothetical protein
MACDELGVSPPAAKAIRCYTSTDFAKADFFDTPNLRGYCTPGREIGVSYNLTPAERVRVAAHEAAHWAGLDEDAAARFAQTFLKRHRSRLLREVQLVWVPVPWFLTGDEEREAKRQRVPVHYHGAYAYTWLMQAVPQAPQPRAESATASPTNHLSPATGRPCPT